MQYSFNIYDFFGYLLPGTVIIILFMLLNHEIQIYPISAEYLGIGGAIVLILLAYIIGHFLHSFNVFMEKKYNNSYFEMCGPSIAFIKATKKQWRYSELFLLDNCNKYSITYKNSIKEAISNIFNISESKINLIYHIDEKNTKDEIDIKHKQITEIFNLCYTYIIQKNNIKLTELFNGLYALYRNLLICIYVAIIIFLSIIIKDFINCNFSPKFYIFCLFLPISIFFIWVFKKQVNHYNYLFADSVYWNLLVSYKVK